MSQVEFHGNGSIQNLKTILEQEKPKSILLVTGRASFESCGLQAALDSLLIDYNVKRFFEFSANPKIEEAEEGIALFRREGFDLVIAAGGGSAMDMGKIIAHIGPQDGAPEEYIKKEREFSNRHVPVIAIPTTAGTGSEATHFAVVYIGKKKYSLSEQSVLPEYAIVDPQFTYNTPQYIGAATYMDALGQAIEAYWSVRATSESQEYSKRAIELLWSAGIEGIVHRDKKAFDAIMKGANLAGKAIHIAMTTACHAMAYPMTSYFGISHGHAVGLTLGATLVHNSKVGEGDCNDSRGVAYVIKTVDDLCFLLGEKSPEGVAQKMTSVMQQLGLKTQLSQLGVRGATDREIIVENGFAPERMKNNPRDITREQMRDLLSQIA